MKMINGRPANTEGRLPRELRVYDLLDRLGIDYGQVDHPAAMTMEACREADEAMGTPMCKNLLLCNRQKTDFYLLMLPGEKHFKTSTFSKTIGSSRLSFADPEYMEAFLDITPGSVSVLGLMNDHDNRVQLVMDEDILKGEYFLDRHFTTKDEAKKAIKEAIWIYNHRRLHEKLNYKTPFSFRAEWLKKVA